MNAHETIINTQKVIPSGVKHDLSNQSLHVAYHYILFGVNTFAITHFMSTQESLYSWVNTLVVVIHRNVFPLPYYHVAI